MLRNSFLILILFWLNAYCALQAAPLNDTGQTNFGNASSNSLTEEAADYPAQDARIGRDAAAKAGKLTKQGGGNAGFDFTKLDANGQDLPASATNHVCVRDNVTGLVWEVKTNDKGLRDQNWTYTWYNSDDGSNGGSKGTANGGKCFDSNNCDTEKYLAQVKQSRLCGFNDWRLPKRLELMSIVDNSKVSPSIDSNYFPNTPSSGFWSSSPNTNYTDNAWYVYFSGGGVSYDDKYDKYAVRLARGGQ